jgi:glycosyltransferase involved in cell wall biosynthesis
MANPSYITFLKNLSTEELSNLYSECRAFIFPQYEDYGLTALEANASGRPVIAFRKGGVLETQVEFSSKDFQGTSVFFEKQEAESLKKAILKFEEIENKFSSEYIRKHAEKFSEEEFINRIRLFVNKKASIT